MKGMEQIKSRAYTRSGKRRTIMGSSWWNNTEKDKEKKKNIGLVVEETR